jgi:hypothetical protein
MSVRKIANRYLFVNEKKPRLKPVTLLSPSGTAELEKQI